MVGHERVPSVLQINVRLSEGGAAGVARTLHDTLPSLGMSSHFVYGYGPHGASSPDENEVGASRLTPKGLVAVNMAAHKFLGSESTLRSRSRWLALRGEISRASIVHLHVVHSYMADVRSLVGMILDLNKPVVWTLHDQWTFTGRCAQPGSCTGYRAGCLECPDLQAYPPAIIDRASTHHPLRRTMISKLVQTGRAELVPCARWLEDDARVSGVPVGRAVPNSVDPAFWAALTDRSGPRSPGRLRVLFICRDLRDSRKVDWETLTLVSQMTGVELTVVGDNSPIELPGARHLPSISDRRSMANLMQENDALIFTSKIDYFPLTIAEALAAGLAVHAIDSMAAREFRGYETMAIYSDSRQMLSGLGAAVQSNIPTDAKPRGLAPIAMAEAYLSIYERLMDK